MEGLLTDKERVDAWELGIQVSQLQARGIRELHHIVQSVQEECRKQVHMLSEKIVQIQMDNNDKLQSVSAPAPLFKGLGASLWSPLLTPRRDAHCRCLARSRSYARSWRPSGPSERSWRR
jgi:hypothetical protein